MQPTFVHVPPGAGLPSARCPVVDAGGREAELRGADGGDVAAGAGADDDDVEVFCHVWLTRTDTGSVTRSPP